MIPFTKYLWKIGYTRIIGITTIIVTVIRTLEGVWLVATAAAMDANIDPSIHGSGVCNTRHSCAANQANNKVTATWARNLAEGKTGICTMKMHGNDERERRRGLRQGTTM